MPLYIALQYSAWFLRYQSVSVCIYKCISFILDGKAVLCMWLISVWAFPFGNRMVICESMVELAKKCILHSVPLPPNKGCPSITIVVMVTVADIYWVLTRYQAWSWDLDIHQEVIWLGSSRVQSLKLPRIGFKSQLCYFLLCDLGQQFSPPVAWW